MKKQVSLKKKNRHIGVRFVLLIYSAIVCIPLYMTIINAFKPREEIISTPMTFKIGTLSLESIQNAWNLMNFPQALMNNIIMLVMSLAIMIVFGSLMGYAVAVVNSKMLNIAYIVSILVITIPFQAIMIPEVILLQDIGLLGTRIGSSMIFVATSLPIVVFLYTGFMKALPKELCEAAVVDGAGMFRTYVSIYMPLLKTVTGTVVIVRGTGIWNDLLVCLITMQGKANMTTMVYRLYSFVSNKLQRWDLVFGATFLVSIPIIILFIFLQKSFVKGVVAGAVKG